MKSIKISLFIIGLISLYLITGFFSINCLAFDHGAGGLWFGVNGQKSLFSFIPSNTSDFIYLGGYGYGVLYGRTIIGGFGFAILDISIFDSPYGIAGGFGGLITGVKIFNSHIVDIDLIIWLGLGGIGVDETEGYFSGMIEFNINMGFKLTRWMELVLFGGYQIIGNIIPGIPFDSFYRYTLTFGIRLAFGS